MNTTTTSLRTIISRYDAFLIDIWGVVKNSQGIFSNAKEALREIQKQGKKVLFFSNTCDRLPDNAAENLSAGGIEATTDQMVTSGMALAVVFRQMDLMRRKILCIGNNATTQYVKTAGGEPTWDWREADAAVLGFFLNDANRGAFNAALNLALQRGKPVILANPDQWLPLSADEIGIGPGVTGTLFEHFTGQNTVKVGKPHPPIYKVAYEKLPGISKGRILAIGDTMETDIQGAANEGIDSLLVLSGVQGIITPGSRLDEFMRTRRLYPTYVLPELSLDA